MVKPKVVKIYPAIHHLIKLLHAYKFGKRPKRGIFQSSTGRLINADINGALNILRKVIGGSLEGITDSGDVNSPERTL